MHDFSQQRELRLHAEIAAEIKGALDSLGVPGILIGALARDLHLHYGAGIPIQRATEDIDFAFAVRSWTEFESLRAKLVESKRFSAVGGTEHRLVHTNTLKVDLVPFGRIESAERTIAWPPRGDIVMDVYGFQECLASANRVLLPGGIEFPIVCPAGLAILKIIAWKDRHRRFPLKDAADLYLILRNYLVISDNEQRLWTDFADWIELPDFDYEHSGARMLGYDMRHLINDLGVTKLAEILLSQLNRDDPGELSREMDRQSPERAFTLLSAMRSGLTS